MCVAPPLLMLISVFNVTECIAMAYPDFLLPQARAQQVECYYDYT